MFGVITGLTRRAGGTQGRRMGRGLFSPKQGNKNFYKGYGARSLGSGDSKGHYHLNPAKIPELIVPDLSNCPLKPYVAYASPKIKVSPIKAPTIDMTNCEVDLKTAIYGRRNSIVTKTSRSSKAGKAKKSGDQKVTDAPAIEAPSSL